MPTPPTLPTYRTMKAHGAPDRALWYGDGARPEQAGRPCTLRATNHGWSVSFDDEGKPWHIGVRTRVWLGPLVDQHGAALQVLDPEPVHVRVQGGSLGAFVKLSVALTAAALAADAAASAAVQAGDKTAADEYRTVRNGLRRASNDALVPFPATKAPACRRCGAGCPECLTSAR